MPLHLVHLFGAAVSPRCVISLVNYRRVIVARSVSKACINGGGGGPIPCAGSQVTGNKAWPPCSLLEFRRSACALPTLLLTVSGRAPSHPKAHLFLTQEVGTWERLDPFEIGILILCVPEGLIDIEHMIYLP